MSSLVSEGGTGPGDQRPLNDKEYALLQRLLSDPFSLPIEFKTWLISYLETSDLTLPMSSIMGLQSTLGISGAGEGTLGVFPAGLILPFAAEAAPIGSKLCDGGSYARSAEQRLWNAIGLRYTVGDDGISFNVPDMQGRVPVMKGAAAYHNTLGKSDGLPLANRAAPHGHSFDFSFNWTPETPMGMHNANVAEGPDITNAAVGAMEPFVGEVAEHTHGSSASASLTRVGVNGQSEGPAFLTLNFIIVS